MDNLFYERINLYYPQIEIGLSAILEYQWNIQLEHTHSHEKIRLILTIVPIIGKIQTIEFRLKRLSLVLI